MNVLLPLNGNLSLLTINIKDNQEDKKIKLADSIVYVERK